MPRCILKIHDEKFNTNYYLEWSTVVDAPVTFGMSRQEFEEYYVERYGTSSVLELYERLERVEEKGSSCYLDENNEGYFQYNRAGEKETLLSKEGILEKFCRNKEKI